MEKRVVAKERVNLGKETVTDVQEVSEEVRKERIDTDGIEHTGRETRDETRR